jgi:Nif-specific regulatory protein
VRRAIDWRELRLQNARLRTEASLGRTIVADSPAMKRVMDVVARVAPKDVTVMLTGESGAGKDVVASVLHAHSRRADKPMVRFNAAAIPSELAEAELFGHTKGAFTGAQSARLGYFQQAHKGTLFIDEIGELPPAIQAKVLRALQSGEVQQVGGRTETVDVRLVVATNRDLAADVKAGKFREDLYYRLNVFPIRVPPLRERREDIPLLAEHMLARYVTELGKPAAGFSQQAMELLQAYDWPGNVRELQNEVQRLVIQIEGHAFITPDLLSPGIRQIEGIVARVKPTKGTLKEMTDQIERWLLIEALREHDNNKTAAAKTLGITREGLHKKLRGFGL